jgi:sugar O-acyltransferase (sialic acid O-acetyltransferase NeuD family)
MADGTQHNEKVLLQGGGEHARVVLDILLDCERHVIALFDPRYSGELFGVPQRGTYDVSFVPDAVAVVAIGDNAVRKKAAEMTRHHFTNVIHPSAILSPRCVYGVGNMILHRAVVQAQARIGNHVIINTGAQIDHDCIINDFVHIAPGVVLCGTVSVGEGTLIGAGATVIPGRNIGKWAKIGAGSLVTKDIPDYAVAVGNPARIIKYNPV